MVTQQEIATRRRKLSDKQQALLEKRLQGKLNQKTAKRTIIPRRSDDSPLPLSSAQQRLWLLNQLEPDNAANNVSSIFRLTGALNVAALEKSLNTLVSRHETLRTTFETQDNRPVQTIAPKMTLLLPVVDLSGLPQAKRDIEATRLAEEEKGQVFDLVHGPLIQAKLFRLGDQDHLLTIILDHIISDGWSLDILQRELSTLYTAFMNGQTPNMPDLPIHYADYALWEQNWLKDDGLMTQLTYWQNRLEGAPPVLELPADRPRPPVMSHRGGQHSVGLSPQVHQALNVLSRQEGATLFMTLLAAFNILLYRYSGQADIVVGAPIANRNRTETENLIGLFLNNLPLRADLSGNPSFQDLLKQVRQTALEGYSNQDIPFEKILEALRPERDQSRTPIFQVFLNLLTQQESKLNLPGITVETPAWETIEAKFDITLYVREKAGQITLRLVYNADLFDHERMIHMLEQYLYLLEQIVAAPDQRIDAFSLITPAMKRHLPEPGQPLQDTWQGAVHALVSQLALQNPGHPALVDPIHQWTYAELDEAGNRVAHYLLANGIEKGNIVAVYAHRSASLVWALLGILKAGAAFTILDPAYPAARLVDYLTITRPQGFIQLDAAGVLPGEVEAFVASACACRLSLPQRPGAAEDALLNRQPAGNPEIEVGPDDLAYIAFTSGSTGRPKAVRGRHGPLSHFIPWQAETFKLGPTDRFSMLSGLSHDPLQRDIFTPLCIGATLHIPDPDIVGRPGQLANWMAQSNITFVHLTPPMCQIMTNTAEGDCVLPNLRYAFFVGDKLTRQNVTQLRSLAPNITCINSYGSTESQRAVGYYLIPPEAETGEGKAVYPLGRGMPNVQLLVLNKVNELAGAGELGEVHLRSPHLAAGYLNDDDLTQARFVTNPFTRQPQDRLYKTGDLGRYLPDGNVTFVSRADRQVKIRGFRIELGEVESVLNNHPGVRDAVITVQQESPLIKRLLAYATLQETASAPTAGDLRQYLKTYLPDYMVPAAFIILDAIPLTPNGKVNYAALPVPDQTRQEGETFLVAPRNALEEELETIWEAVLKINPIGVHDNFFDLGGHSLLAVELFSHIENVFGRKLPLATLFEAPTIEQLGEVIQQDNWTPSDSVLAPIQAKGTRLPFFCVTPPMGSVVGFSSLAKHLGQEQSFYGLHLDEHLQLKAVENNQDIRTPEDIAAHYITEIKKVQPSGPYLLGGRCFGTYVAFEMARQLVAQGETVALLAMLTARPHDFQQAYSHYARRLLYHLRDGHLTEALQHSLPAIWSKKSKKLKNKVQHIKQARAEEPAYSYKQEVYPGRITVFQTNRATEQAWAELAAGGVDFHVIPGTHRDIFHEPGVQRLARHLGAALEQAQRQASSS